MKKLLILVFLSAISVLCYAQSTYQYGIMPSVNLQKKFPKSWSANAKIESRQSLYNKELKYNYLLTDIGLVITKRIAPDITLGGGYLLRAEVDTYKNRAVQQISYGKKYSGWRMSHRIVTDQTFEKNNDTEFRLRYRISSEIPLSGQSPDVKEFYLKLSNEYLNSWQKDEYDLEIRWAALLGYSITPVNDLEIGFDYRLDSFIYGDPRNRIWLSINFFHLLETSQQNN
jgi:hypothetical protein